jgi:hypothetical protein
MTCLEAPMNTRRDGWTRLLEFDELEGEPPAIALPEDLGELPQETLDQLLTDMVEQFDEVRNGDVDAQALALLTALADNIRALRAENERRETVAAEAMAEVEALTALVHPPEASDAPPEGETDEQRREREAREERERREREGEPPEADTPADEAEADEVITPELVPASAAPRARLPLGTVARHAPRPATMRERLGVTITAAADVPGLSTGSRVATMERVAEAFHERARLMRDGQSAPVVRIDYPVPEGNWLGQPGVSDWEVIERARLFPGIEALTAAGGWCAPLEPLYNICRIDAASGLLDLPTVRVTRGGFQVPSPITMPADLSTVSWKWTNQNDIDAGLAGAPDPVKPCIRIPCPTWTPYELAAYGICVTHGNLTDRAFPELTREYLGMVGNAHLHAQNGARIATIEAGSTAIDGPEVGSAASSIVGAAELAGEFYREKYHMATSSPSPTPRSPPCSRPGTCGRSSCRTGSRWPTPPPGRPP